MPVLPGAAVPKHGQLLEAEKQRGRKALLDVRQTRTRDIQDRVQMPLQSADLRVAILGGNVDPRKREDWITRRVNMIDALICNPLPVETGMDLTIVYFEINYSLSSFWQSLRRFGV